MNGARESDHSGWSPYVTESGIRNPANFLCWNPESSGLESKLIWNPESTKVWNPKSTCESMRKPFGEKTKLINAAVQSRYFKSGDLTTRSHCLRRKLFREDESRDPEKSCLYCRFSVCYVNCRTFFESKQNKSSAHRQKRSLETGCWRKWQVLKREITAAGLPTRVQCFFFVCFSVFPV